MVSKLTIDNYIRKIESSSHEEQLLMMSHGLIKLFHLSNVYFFRYSSIGFQSDGVFYIDSNKETESITNIQDDLRSLPVILSVIKNRKAAFISNETFFTHSPNFTNERIAANMVIMPICLSANVAGYTISTKMDNNFK